MPPEFVPSKSDWRCWRLWYQGPPGARGFYVYRDSRFRRWCFRVLGHGVHVGLGKYSAWWAFRYPKVP